MESSNGCLPRTMEWRHNNAPTVEEHVKRAYSPKPNAGGGGLGNLTPAPLENPQVMAPGRRGRGEALLWRNSIVRGIHPLLLWNDLDYLYTQFVIASTCTIRIRGLVFGIPPTYLEGLYISIKTDHSESDFGVLPQITMWWLLAKKNSFPLSMESSCHSTLCGLSYW
jgi:hypothetical protein